MCTIQNRKVGEISLNTIKRVTFKTNMYSERSVAEKKIDCQMDQLN